MYISPRIFVRSEEIVSFHGRESLNPGRTAKDTVEFSESHGLERELRTAPAVRTEKVAEARQLASDPAYPPPEMIRRIAALLGQVI